VDFEMTTKELTDIWARIEEQRANYQSIIDSANKAIELARESIKEARRGLDALPVAKVRRVRKTTPMATLNGVDESDGV
jgi:hypothetical protein